MRIRWRGLELPTRVLCEDETQTDNYGKFMAEPFERGYGVTVGNSLRRVLLSSLEGAAVVAFKIAGVHHEFSSLDGVLEDVTDIALNLKQLLCQIHSEEPKTLKIDLSKKGTVTGADIQCDADTEVISKDLHIATLTDNVQFGMEIEVKKGRGYVTAEENQRDPAVIGRIAIDSSFSPVRRVRYRTEDTRVGQRTNYDRLILEVWTDGTVTPELALVEASKILRKHLDPFVQYFELGHELQAGQMSAIEESGDDWDEVGPGHDVSINQLNIPARAQNCLAAENIRTLGDLILRSEEELLELKNFGKASLDEIMDELKTRGLSLAGA